MLSTSRPHTDSARMRADRAELVDRITRALPEDGKRDALGGLFYLHRESSPTEPLHAVSYPSVCVMAQGAKVLHLGDADHRYDPFHYLLITAELPVSSEIVEASEETPYLSMVLRLDPETVGQVMIEAGEAGGGGRSEPLALDVSPLGEDLLDAALRLVRLIEAPEEAGVVAPLVMREIVFRLLRGAQGDRLRQVAALGGHDSRVAPAIRRLHEAYAEALPVEELAEAVGLSASRFHHHFKAVTGMTPLQFQKQLRLQEARRLLVADDLDAATVGYRVGYASASHFSRDYKRMFGAPPLRDAERLRAA